MELIKAYETLGVSCSDTHQVIKAAYKKLLNKHNLIIDGDVIILDLINTAFLTISKENGWSDDSTQRYRRQTRSEDVIIHVHLSLLDIFTGTTRVIESPTSVRCTTCNTCRCYPICDQCEACVTCQGAGIIHGTKQHTVNISQGIQDGHRISLNGYIDQYKTRSASNLIVQIHENDHLRFKRKHNNLYTNVTITLLQALTISTIKIERLDGTFFYFKWTKPLSRLNERHSIEGEGMKRKQQVGKLYVSYTVELPHSPIENIANVLPPSPDLLIPDDATVFLLK